MAKGKALKRGKGAADFNHLALRMQQIADGVGKAVEETVNDASRIVFRAVAAATPVDVGTARSNWNIGLGAPNVGSRRPAFSPYVSRYGRPKGPGGDRSEVPNLYGVMGPAYAKIRTRKPGQDVYITNIVPYLEPLNKGHSKQAPRNFVRLAVMGSMPAIVRAAVFQLKKELE